MFRQYNASSIEGKNNRLSFYLFNQSGGLGVSGDIDEPIEEGEWIFLVGVYNGTHVSIFKNGVLKDAQALAELGIHPQDGPAPLYVGTADGDSYFVGALDEVSIYRRALTPRQIRQLYEHK